MDTYLKNKILFSILSFVVIIFSFFGLSLKAEAAAPVVASKGTVNNVTTGNLTLTLPASIAANDIIVVAVVYWSPNSSSNIDPITAPTGYTQISETATPHPGQ